MKKYILISTLLLSTTALSNGIEDMNTPIVQNNVNGNMKLNLPKQGLGLVQTAFDNKDSLQHPIKIYNYDNGRRIFKIRLRTRIGTTVIVPETIESFIVGDKAGFTFKPLSPTGTGTNKGVVYAHIAGVDTNLNIIGKSGKVYAFYLRADNEKSNHIPHFVVNIKDNSPQGAKLNTAPLNPKFTTDKQAIDFLSSKPDLDLKNVSYNYKQKGGNTEMMPLRIFDDGIFTYFQFAEKSLIKTQELPTIYRSIGGKDYPVNMRVQGGFVVVERTAKNWTLRLGKEFACIKAGSE